VASSGRVSQRYIVSQIRVLRGDDSAPMAPTETPRLSLMICTGTWCPLTGDYSHRVWVIAEPPELARETLSATVARQPAHSSRQIASQPTVQGKSPADAAQIRADAAFARTALLLMDTKRHTRP